MENLSIHSILLLLPFARGPGLSHQRPPAAAVPSATSLARGPPRSTAAFAQSNVRGGGGGAAAWERSAEVGLRETKLRVTPLFPFLGKKNMIPLRLYFAQMPSFGSTCLSFRIEKLLTASWGKKQRLSKKVTLVSAGPQIDSGGWRISSAGHARHIGGKISSSHLLPYKGLMSSSVVTSLATEVLCWSRGAPPLIEVAGEGVYIHTYCGVVRSRCCCCTRRRSCLIDPIPSLLPSFVPTRPSSGLSQLVLASMQPRSLAPFFPFRSFKEPPHLPQT